MSDLVDIGAGVLRLRAPNPGMMTGSGTNTYLIPDAGVVIDPGPADAAHVDAIVDALNGNVQAVLVTHTHRDHSPAAALLAENPKPDTYPI